MLQLHHVTTSVRCDFLLSCNPEALHKHCAGRGELRILVECADTPHARREVFRALRATLGAPEEVSGDRLVLRFASDRVSEGVAECSRCITRFARVSVHTARAALCRAASESRARRVCGAFRTAAVRARATNDADSALASRLKVLGTGMHVAAGWLSHLSRDDWCAWLMRN